MKMRPIKEARTDQRTVRDNGNYKFLSLHENDPIRRIASQVQRFYSESRRSTLFLKQTSGYQAIGNWFARITAGQMSHREYDHVRNTPVRGLIDEILGGDSCRMAA